jgi:hypothetical protein
MKTIHDSTDKLQNNHRHIAYKRRMAFQVPHSEPVAIPQKCCKHPEEPLVTYEEPLIEYDDAFPPPPVLKRSNAMDEKEQTPPNTQITGSPQKKVKKSSPKKKFVCFDTAEQSSLFDSEGYFTVQEQRDHTSSLTFRRAVKTARLKTGSTLNEFLIKAIDGTKTNLVLNGRNAPRAPGAALERALSSIQACTTCQIPVSVSLLKDLGYGGKVASAAIQKFKSSL